MALNTGGASRFPKGGGGPSQTRGNLAGLLEILGPQYKTEFELEKANAIIDALMKGREGQGSQGGQKKTPQTTGGAGMGAQAAPQAPSFSGGLGPMFYRMFNTAPESMNRLTRSIVGARNRPAGMI